MYLRPYTGPLCLSQRNEGLSHIKASLPLWLLALQEFRRLHLPGHVLLEDPESGFFFVATGQEADRTQGELPSAAWAWHSHEAESVEVGEVGFSGLTRGGGYSVGSLLST